MEYKDRPSDQRGQGQGNQKPGQGGQQGGREGQGGNQKPGQGGRQGQGGSDKSTTRHTPSGVPNEGRSAEGEIPNPEYQKDRGSRSGFDGNAAEQVATDETP